MAWGVEFIKSDNTLLKWSAWFQNFMFQSLVHYELDLYVWVACVEYFPHRLLIKPSSARGCDTFSAWVWEAKIMILICLSTFKLSIKRWTLLLLIFSKYAVKWNNLDTVSKLRFLRIAGQTNATTWEKEVSIEILRPRRRTLKQKCYNQESGNSKRNAETY